MMQSITAKSGAPKASSSSGVELEHCHILVLACDGGNGTLKAI
jgi:hypothetical protein